MSGNTAVEEMSEPPSKMSSSESEVSRDTLFVRNVARGINEEEIRDLFGEIGPVKECFLVVEKYGPKKGVSKGFGFVKYALEDDAEQAIEKLNGHLLNGKQISVHRAGKKGYKPSAAEKKNHKKNPKTVLSEKKQDIFSRLAAQATVVGDEKEKENSLKKKEELLRSCSVVYFGIPSTLTEPQFKKKAAKVGKINAVEFPISSFHLGSDHGTINALVIYTKPENAAKAITKLSGKLIDSGLVHVRRIKQIATTQKSKSRCRLIIRNLAFNLAEKDLRTAFSHYGPLTDIQVSVNGSNQKLNKGFAFVQFACRGDAQKAINSLNGKLIGKRPVAVDFAVEKTQYQKQKSKLEVNDEGAKEDEESGNTGSETAIDKKSMKNYGDDEEDEDVDEKEEEEEDDDDNDFEDDNQEKEKEKKQNDEEDSEEEEDVGSVDGPDQVDDANRPTNHKSKDKTHLTLFIRNLSFECTEDDVYKLFRQYGGVKYAKIVREPETKRSKGVAFVQFYQPAGMERALTAAASTPLQSVREERLKQKLGRKAAIKGSGGTGIFMNGRPLMICRAVDREEANTLKENGERKTKVDKRHLYLAREGMVHANPELASRIPKLDLNKRIHSEAERKTKLKSPLFFVSPTRLSIRNLNRNEKPVQDSDINDDYVTDHILKKEFLKAAEIGMRQGVVGDNEGDPYLFPIGWPKNRNKYLKPKIFQCRMIRDDPKDLSSSAASRNRNRGRPKGYGFVEFSEHVHALSALRVLNNNPEYAYLAFGGKKAMERPKNTRSRLVVEFAVENAAKVREQQRKVDMVKRRQQLEINKTKVETVTAEEEKHPKKKPKEKANNRNMSPKQGAITNAEKVKSKKNENNDTKLTSVKKSKEAKLKKTKVKQAKRKNVPLSEPKKKQKKQKVEKDMIDMYKETFFGFGTNGKEKKISRWFD